MPRAPFQRNVRHLPDFPDREERTALVRTRGVTLNGRPARIAGISLDFPVVSYADGSGSVEYSWQAVRLVVNQRGAAFRTS